jgi:hypothetical protein
MKQAAAPMGRAIKIVTTIVILLDSVFFAGAVAQRAMLLPAALLLAAILACYWFWTPVAYELEGNELIVSFRMGRKRYGPVVRNTPFDASFISFTVRLFGNGGLFSGSGIFWNRRLGVFRAYVTTSGPELILVETAKTKIVISPENPALWLLTAETGAGRTG